MGFDFAIFGELEFPSEGARSAWLAAPLAADHTDWSGPLAQVLPELAGSTGSQALIRIALRATQRTAPVDIDVTFDEGEDRASVRGYVDGEAVAGGIAHELAVLFRSAASHGAVGTLHFVAIGRSLAFEVAVSDGTSTFRKLPEDLCDDPRIFRIFDWYARRVRARARRPSSSTLRRAAIA